MFPWLQKSLSLQQAVSIPTPKAPTLDGVQEATHVRVTTVTPAPKALTPDRVFCKIINNVNYYYVNPFNFAAIKFCIFEGSKFHCY